MYTDPNHIRIEDPGQVEGNPVFIYLDAFGEDKAKVQELKEHYKRGGLGDSTVKKYLLEVLQAFLEPIRNRRAEYAKEPKHVMQMLMQGTEQAEKTAARTLTEVREAMCLNYPTKAKQPV